MKINNKDDWLSFIPNSIWRLEPDYKKYKVIFEDNNKEIRKERGEGSGQKFSQFNPLLAERCIEFWSKKGDLILDPFMGRATRGVVCLNMGRSYCGYDVCPKTFEFVETILNKSEQTSLFEREGKASLYLGDGCELAYTKDNSVDMIFTCPPYWNVEKYTSIDGQLSDCKTYEDFLSKINIFMKNAYRVLKDNTFCVIIISDLRVFLKERKNNRTLIPLHSHIIDLALKNRFQLWDINIVELKTPFVQMVSEKSRKSKHTCRSHEYVLVFKKW